MEKFEKIVNIINKILIYFCSLLLLFMLFLSTADVIGRYLFNKAIIGTLEVIEILVPAIVLLGLSYTQMIKSHISVDFFYSRLPQKLQAMLGVFTTLWAIILFIIVAWQGTKIAILYYEMNSIITNIHVPTYIVRLLVPIGAVAIILVFIVDLFQFIRKIKKEG